MRRLALLLVLGTAILPLASAQQKFTYPDLVRRLTDLEHLATLPAPGETTRQWSSYDRASNYDEPTGRYVRWDANGDGGGIIRREGDAMRLVPSPLPALPEELQKILAEE